MNIYSQLDVRVSSYPNPMSLECGRKLVHTQKAHLKKENKQGEHANATDKDTGWSMYPTRTNVCGINCVINTKELL